LHLVLHIGVQHYANRDDTYNNAIGTGFLPAARISASGNMWRHAMPCGTVGGMHKTTVYLPDELKVALARTAEETRRSEADLIREDIQFVVSQRDVPPPRTGIFDSAGSSLSERVDELLAGFGQT